MHKNEGTLRAYMDGELDAQACAAVAAHLRECSACRRELESLASRASATSHYLRALSPRGAELPAPAPVALARLYDHLADERPVPQLDSRRDVSGGWVEMFQRMFNTRYRAAWAGLAALVVVAALFTLAPVQAAASQFLGLFRVRKFAAISVNPASLQNLDMVSGQIDRLLSDEVTFAQEPSDPVAVASAAEASQKANIPVRLPTALTSAPRLTVQGGVEATAKIDLARAQAILDAAGRSDIKLPASLDGANVEFAIPSMVTAEYDCGAAVVVKPTNDLGGAPAARPAAVSSKCVVFTQLASPSLDVPAGVDVNQLGEAMLQLFGLSAQDARHFARTIDWSSTLVIPVPSDAATFRDVTVDGVPGVLVQSDTRKSGGPSRTHYALFWQKSDIVYALSGVGDPARAVEIADSLR